MDLCSGQLVTAREPEQTLKQRLASDVKALGPLGEQSPSRDNLNKQTIKQMLCQAHFLLYFNSESYLKPLLSLLFSWHTSWKGETILLTQISFAQLRTLSFIYLCILNSNTSNLSYLNVSFKCHSIMLYSKNVQVTQCQVTVTCNFRVLTIIYIQHK